MRRKVKADLTLRESRAKCLMLAPKSINKNWR
jgi:hypothetical protein